jgi:uncharacterized repeat protein (TIGR01451 family)
MIRHIAVILILIATTLNVIAAEQYNSVSVKYKSMTLAFVQQPLKADAKLLPLIDGTITGGSKERFGIYLGGTPSSTTILEILDNTNAVVKSISINDLLGKGISRETNVLASSKPRRAFNTYVIRLPQGDAELVIKSIATGDEFAADQQLIVIFALKTASPMAAALRLQLPCLGTSETAGNGFVIVAKSGAAAFAASVIQSRAVIADKNKITITSDVKTTEAASETAMLWLVIKGVTSSSPTDAKTQALRVIKDNAQQAGQPQLVIVNAADKEKLTKADTTSYSIICVNIGTGDATSIVLANPIPKGTKYVAGSGTREGAVLNEENENSEVQNLKWTFSTPLSPGQERIVRFKVVVQ